MSRVCSIPAFHGLTLCRFIVWISYNRNIESVQNLIYNTPHSSSIQYNNNCMQNKYARDQTLEWYR